MRFGYHPDALEEYAQAALFYEGREPGLGGEFTLAIEAGIQSILEAPDRWPFLEGDIRRHLLRRFPYGILYTIERDLVLIVAIMHLSREPGCWRHRVS